VPAPLTSRVLATCARFPRFVIFMRMIPALLAVRRLGKESKAFDVFRPG
jgi:hypothetical protein